MFPGESVVALTGQTQSAEVTAPFQEAGYRTMTAAFHLLQDGTIKYEIKLTGELSTNPLSFGEESPEYGTLVMEGGNAQHHQHMFCARLDMAVDDQEGGKGLYVSEVTCCAVLCHAVLCCGVLCCAVPCCATLCRAVLRCAVPCCAVPCCALPCHAVLSCPVPCHAMLSCSCQTGCMQLYA